MRRLLPILAAGILVAACGDEVSNEPVSVPTYNIDSSRITVSGVSSGAMMATQFHVAHSDLVGGVAMIAGGPYYCAMGQLSRGLGVCVKGGDPDVDAMIAYTRSAAETGAIDDPANLDGDPVWLFHGSGDIAVHLDTTHAARDFYTAFGGQIAAVVESIPAAHGFPTLDTGVGCGDLMPPFLNACDYDAAGELLAALNGPLEARGAATGQLVAVPQPGAADALMLPQAMAYVPEACAAGASCGVHIAFHGCQQSTAFVADAFVTGAGYNEWAEANSLIVLYPQVDSSKVMPLNPLGCWDWWGYTDEHYATRDGAQVAVVKVTLDLLAGETL
jgi:acetyl esterase/lipase